MCLYIFIMYHVSCMYRHFPLGGITLVCLEGLYWSFVNSRRFGMDFSHHLR